jgi:hypothetical protein
MRIDTAHTHIGAAPSTDHLPPATCPTHLPNPQALTQWMAERAVLPIENSLGGSIHTVYDLLLRYRLHIVGETSIAVNHCLMALPGTKIGDVKRAMSHPQVGGRVPAAGRAASAVPEGWQLGQGRCGPAAWTAGRVLVAPSRMSVCPRGDAGSACDAAVQIPCLLAQAGADVPAARQQLAARIRARMAPAC